MRVLSYNAEKDNTHVTKGEMCTAIWGEEVSERERARMRETEWRESLQPAFNKWGRRDPPDK
jgi:hypothetical protein